MTNEPSWDEIFSSQPHAGNSVGPGSDSFARSDVPVDPRRYNGSNSETGPLTRRELREREYPSASRSNGGFDDDFYRGPAPKKKRRLGWLWALIVVIVLAAGAAGTAWLMFEPQVRKIIGWELPIDYVGVGNGTVVEVVIESGQIGEDIARTLYTSGVTMTFEAFYQLLLENPSASFQPGTYSLQEQMSAQSAFAALNNPDSRIVARAVIPEGSTMPTILKRVADATGVSVDELTTASKDYPSLGLPKTLPSLEGYLFPATYTFDPGLSAQQLLQVMVDRMNESLDAAGVAPEDRHRVLSLAALIQKEGGSTADFLKVSRVFTNRIEQGMLLQSDATVSYGSGSTSIFTSDAERADASNPYNTYVHKGLPIGPISAPGDAAINAALNPVDGPWLFFVLINGKTGETAFSRTVGEHDAAVRVWQQWLRDNPDWSTG